LFKFSQIKNDDISRVKIKVEMNSRKNSIVQTKMQLTLNS